MSFHLRLINILRGAQANVFINLGTETIHRQLLRSYTIADIRDMLTKDNNICSNTLFTDENNRVIQTSDEKTITIDQLTNKHVVVQLGIIPTTSVLPEEKQANKQVSSQSNQTTTSTTAVPSQWNLNAEMWRQIFTNANMLYGIEKSTNSPSYGRRPALQIRQPEGSNICPMFRFENITEASVYVTDNDVTSSFVSNRLFDISIESSDLSTGELFAIKFSNRTRNMDRIQRKYFTSCLHFPRIVVTFDSSYVEPTAEFIRKVDEIIRIADIDEQYTKLDELFSEYGQIYSHKITLGAHFYCKEWYDIRDHNEEQDKIRNVRTKLNDILVYLSNLNEKINIENRSQKNISEQNTSMSIQTVGGETSRIFEPSGWMKTIDCPDKWNAIKHEDCKWIPSILDEQRQRNLKNVTDYYLKMKKVGHLYSRWKQDAITLNMLDNSMRPKGMTIDDNQAIYFVDNDNHCVIQWKFNDKTCRIVAGDNGCGKGNNQLSYPTDVLLDKRNNCLIIADQENQRIMRWSLRDRTNTGQVLIDEISCQRLAMDKYGTIYISDPEHNQVYRWNPTERILTVVAGGNGKGNHLNQLNTPSFIFVDENESLYISDMNNHRVMKWLKNATEGVIVAGGNQNGNRINQLRCPQGLITDPFGRVYIADNDHRIVRWKPGNTRGEIIVGGNRNGNGSNELYYPSGLCFDSKGNLYVADRNNHRIQKFPVDLD